jgi:hypothetical protein
MDNPFDPKNEDALREAFVADGWRRYVIIGHAETGSILRPVLDNSEPKQDEDAKGR